jgi:hypothetical protein
MLVPTTSWCPPPFIAGSSSCRPPTVTDWWPGHPITWVTSHRSPPVFVLYLLYRSSTYPHHHAPDSIHLRIPLGHASLPDPPVRAPHRTYSLTLMQRLSMNSAEEINLRSASCKRRFMLFKPSVCSPVDVCNFDMVFTNPSSKRHTTPSSDLHHLSSLTRCCKCYRLTRLAPLGSLSMPCVSWSPLP